MSTVQLRPAHPPFVAFCGHFLSLVFLALAPEDDVLVVNLQSSDCSVFFQLGKRLSAQSQRQSY